ncbi:MAG: DUF4832 domain-containing protein [Ruminococcaceae bacterium]|nr:DUF4832 domain-containing protein [Oscillospiraceae bacterium]
MIHTNHFSYKPEEVQNPYIGFLSFQHFRGESLYSDVIVRPEGNMTETEDLECYPIPGYVPQNGRDEGFYPDTTVCYIRSLWKEFEPRRGEYNYEFIEDIIEKAKAHNQSLIFRLMPHSTRACDDVPDWLRELIPCPDRPDGKRVKDSPTDPLFLEYFGEAIRAFGERFDSDPTLYAVDICMPGAWGEGHNLHLYSEESLTKLVDIYTSVFKNTLLMGQITNPEMIHYANRTASVGWRGDGFGEPQHINERYPRQVEKIAEVWKKAPVSFESYWWLGEWQRKGWNLDNIIDLTLRWHVSSFNAKSLPIPMEWKDKIEYWVQKMGYHFKIDSFSFPEYATRGGTVDLELAVDNVGVAPIYKQVPLHIRLVGETEINFTTDVDITKWMPGKSNEKFSITLPCNMSAGEYDIEIGIYNEENPTLYLCTDAPRNGSYYKVGKININ